MQDYIGYGYFAGQVNHIHKACIKCMDGMKHLQLEIDPGSSKTVYVGHRRWLDENDSWRRCGDLFNGENELRGPPPKRNGEEIKTLLNNWEECPAPGKKRKAPVPLMKVWKTKSVFWDLAYWSILAMPHCLDVMHITKNVCESLALCSTCRRGPKTGRKQEATC